MSLKSFHIHDQKHIDSLSPFFSWHAIQRFAIVISQEELLEWKSYIYFHLSKYYVESTFHAKDIKSKIQA